jgi:hypothetical protein
MDKNFHEIRDPIHVFVRLDSDERKVLNSRPFQRLRYVHQLALSYLVYPGATHRRFEHSLGVMELAGRVYDVVTNPDNITDDIKNLLSEITSDDKRRYWRRVLRMAALCHDVGHLPFSHAAEKDLLPDGWDHERLTRELVTSDEMKGIWDELEPPLRPDHVVKLAVGPKKAKDLSFSDWEAILAEIIVGDAFGVDRMDYLLRDSYHAGVAYGRFDHFRLIDTLRILTSSQTDGSKEPALGVQEGGIQSAEALLLARYFMYSQVYFHPVRRIYDHHLKEFLEAWLSGGKFSTDLAEHLAVTDNEVTAAMLGAALDPTRRGHAHARRIVRRDHFKVLYSRNPQDVDVNPESGQAIFNAMSEQFGPELFHHDRYSQKGGSQDFPVQAKDGRIVSSMLLSEALQHLPLVSIDAVYVDPAKRDEVKAWLSSRRAEIIKPKEEAPA